MPTTNVLGDYIGSGSVVIVEPYRAISWLDTGFYAGALTISPSLGIIFGLFVGFRAAQVWSDSARAEAAVDREASALRTVTLFAAALPAEMQNRLRSQVRSYIAVRLRGESAGHSVHDLSFAKVQLTGEVGRFLPLFKR